MHVLNYVQTVCKDNYISESGKCVRVERHFLNLIDV